jgi:hypothetical protein
MKFSAATAESQKVSSRRREREKKIKISQPPPKEVKN